MNIGVHVSFWIRVFQIGTQEWNCWIMWKFYFYFLRKLHTVLHNGCTNLHSHQQWESSPPFIICRLFDDNRSDRCEVIPPCCFDLHLKLSKQVEHLFMCLLVICMSSLEKCLFRSSAHFLIGLFVFLILSYMSCSYILEIKPLLVASFANIFSHSVGCLFILFMFVYKPLLCKSL